MRQAAFLDRDGVLNCLVRHNGKAVAPRLASEFVLLPNVRRAVEALRRAGLLLIVVTNQPDVARGLLRCRDLERMHVRLRRAIPVDVIYTCPHDGPDGCACRKPKPGLLLRASTEWGIRLKDSFLVGDSWKDIGAGKAAGCTTILISPDEQAASGADFVVRDLPAAARLILRQQAVRQGTTAVRC